jgi:hypothetical protein
VLPFNAHGAYAFADPGCTRQVLLLSPARDAPPFRFGLLFTDALGCNPTRHPSLHALEDYTGPIFGLSGRECSPVSEYSASQMFELGEPLDPSDTLARAP